MIALRADKFLFAVRLIKTRSQATVLCKSGKVQVGGKNIKPSAPIVPGHLISIKRNTAVFSFKVLALTERRLAAKLVPEYLRDMTSPEEREKFAVYQLAQKEHRQFYGKPTTKQRRDRRKFLNPE